MHALFLFFLLGNSYPLLDEVSGDSTSFLLQTIDVGQPLTTIAFSPDGSRLAAAGDGPYIYLFHPDLGITLQTLTSEHETINTLVFSPDNEHLVSGGSDGAILLWNLSTGQQVQQWQTANSGTQSISFSTDGRFLVGASGKMAQIWEVASGQPLQAMEHEHRVEHVGFNPDGTQLITSSADHIIHRWHIDSGYTLNSYVHHSAQVNTLAWSAIPNLLASGSDDRQLIVWSPDRHKPYLMLSEEPTAVQSVAFGCSGSLLASATKGSRIQLWDLANEVPVVALAEIPQHPIAQLAFSPLGNTLASCGPSGTIHLWDIPDLQERFRLLMTANAGDVIPENADTNPDRQSAQQQRRQGRYRRQLERRLIDYYEKQLDWRRAFSLGAYDNQSEQFTIHSAVLGDLLLRVPRTDALLVIEQAHLLEYRYLQFEIVEGEIQVQAATAYLRGMNRRYQTSQAGF